jgi:hypothetical protein
VLQVIELQGCTAWKHVPATSLQQHASVLQARLCQSLLQSLQLLQQLFNITLRHHYL